MEADYRQNLFFALPFFGFVFCQRVFLKEKYGGGLGTGTGYCFAEYRKANLFFRGLSLGLTRLCIIVFRPVLITAPIRNAI
jgi:hypothetical protein